MQIDVFGFSPDQSSQFRNFWYLSEKDDGEMQDCVALRDSSAGGGEFPELFVMPSIDMDCKIPMA